MWTNNHFSLQKKTGINTLGFLQNKICKKSEFLGNKTANKSTK